MTREEVQGIVGACARLLDERVYLLEKTAEAGPATARTIWLIRLEEARECADLVRRLAQ